MINGIGSSYNNYYNYQNTISQLRLQQALAKNPKYQRQITEAAQNTYSAQYKSSSMDFLRDYTSTMSDVMQSANSLKASNTAGVMNSLTAVSSETDVASVTNRYSGYASYAARPAQNMTLEVSQVATAQQNRSDGVKSGALAEGDMAFTISGPKGNVDINISATKDSGATKTNGQMLREAAAAINKSDAGVIASVTQENGKAVLSLQSRSTGTDAAFEVSGQMGAAEGLQNISEEAVNAEYSVTTNGETKDYTSQSNSIQLDMGRIQADLKTTGTTDISVGPDTDKVVSAVSDLLKNYNKAVGFLQDNASHGRGTASQLQNFERSIGAAQSLKKLGITTDKEGQLVLDKEALTKALQEEPTLAKDLLSGRGGLAENLYNRSSSAMNTNSASLISNDLRAIDQDRFSDPFQFANMYSKHGAYTLNNYAALGLMMNYLV